MSNNLNPIRVKGSPNLKIGSSTETDLRTKVKRECEICGKDLTGLKSIEATVRYKQDSKDDVYNYEFSDKPFCQDCLESVFSNDFNEFWSEVVNLAKAHVVLDQGSDE